MANEHCLGPVSQIPPGEGRTFKVGEHRVAVFHTRYGGVYATQAHCPHLAGPLADGMVGEGILVCPLHDWRFDLKTGATLNGKCGITVYPVCLLENGEIVVTLEGVEASGHDRINRDARSSIAHQPAGSAPTRHASV